MYCQNLKSSESGADYYCGQELIAVPLFTSVQYLCPLCEPHRIPKPMKAKVDEIMRKKLGFDENGEAEILLPPDEPLDIFGTGTSSD